MTAAKKIFENLAFTHKVHEKQAELMSLGSQILRILILTSLLFSLWVQLVQLIPNFSTGSLTTLGIISTIVGIGLAFYQLNFNYDKLLDSHREAAKDLLEVKNKMIVAMDNGMTKAELNAFVDELNPIYRRAPQTGWLANILASIGSPKKPKKKT